MRGTRTACGNLLVRAIQWLQRRFPSEREAVRARSAAHLGARARVADQMRGLARERLGIPWTTHDAGRSGADIFPGSALRRHDDGEPARLLLEDDVARCIGVA